MLILTQDRKTIVNTDRFDILTAQHVPMTDHEGGEIVAVKLLGAGEEGKDFEESLAMFIKPETAEAVLFEIADAARTGQTGYIMPD